MFEYKFLLGYSVFICFFLFMLTQSAPQILGPEYSNKIGNVTSKLSTMSNQNQEWYYGLLDSITNIWDAGNVLWILLTVNSSVAWVSLLIFTPYTITLGYILIRLARGGG